MNRPLRTLIVDDEPLAIERMQVLAGAEPAIDLVGTASDGQGALRMVEALSPDLILCDISMPGLDGLDVARAVGQLDPRPALVFVTAFDRYAVAAFDVEAVDYLLKPVAADRLARAVMRARDMLADAPPPQAPASVERWLTEFWVQHRNEMLRIETTQVQLIEAERDYMRVHGGARSWLIHQTIKELERRLDPVEFIRVHRSTIVRRDAVRSLVHHGDGAWSVDLGERGQHRIGRTYLADVKALMSGGSVPAG